MYVFPNEGQMSDHLFRQIPAGHEEKFEDRSREYGSRATRSHQIPQEKVTA